MESKGWDWCQRQLDLDAALRQAQQSLRGGEVSNHDRDRVLQEARHVSMHAASGNPQSQEPAAIDGSAPGAR
eukprot:14133792-Alexandrium_andersonii.AAC.1